MGITPDVAMSAIGTYRIIRPHPRLSAIGVTADIGLALIG
jgi:hypothetical protein